MSDSFEKAGTKVAAGLPVDDRVLIGRAKIKAFQFPKGKSGNPGGLSKFYYQARALAREASPKLMESLIDLAQTAEDERVRSVCLVAVLDRAGLKPIDYDPAEERQDKPRFDPRAYTAQELDVIEQALRLMLRPAGEIGAVASPIDGVGDGIAPDVADES